MHFQKEVSTFPGINTNNWQGEPHKTKKLLLAKETIKQVKIKSREQVWIFACYTPGWELVLRIYKKFKKQRIKRKKINQLKSALGLWCQSAGSMTTLWHRIAINVIQPQIMTYLKHENVGGAGI